MSGQRHRPLEYKDVATILQNLGFTQRPRKATSHEQWVRENPKLHKVTVDAPKAPFSQDLIKNMAWQAGLSKKQFYAALDKNKAKSIAKKVYKVKKDDEQGSE